MKFIILILLSGCATQPVVTSPKTKYEPGDCVYLVNSAGHGNKDNMMRVEQIGKDRYIYRWWLYQQKWSDSLTYSKFGSFNIFDKFTKKRDCP